MPGALALQVFALGNFRSACNFYTLSLNLKAILIYSVLCIMLIIGEMEGGKSNLE
jgi:hypothetical protein